MTGDLGVGGGDPYPCGGGPGTDGSYGDCCGPLHRQARLAPTAEALMRSRYSAHALGETDHLWRTWWFLSLSKGTRGRDPSG